MNIRLEQSKPTNRGVTVCKQIWQRRQTLPTEAELALHVATYIIKREMEEVIRLNCSVCSGDAQDPDGIHTCGWPIDPINIATLATQIMLTEDDVETFLSRVVGLFAPLALLPGVSREFKNLHELATHAVIQNDGDLPDMYQGMFENLRDIESVQRAAPAIDLFNML